MFEFRYPKPNTRMPQPPRKGRPAGTKTHDEDPFTGWVNGRRASQLEERWARVARDEIRVDSFHFSVVFGIIPHHIELDFRMFVGSGIYLVQLDAEWIHKGASARAHDMSQDARLNEMHKGKGNVYPVSRIEEKFIKTPKLCQRTLTELMAGRVFQPWVT